jgi:spore maturation protein SpmA
LFYALLAFAAVNRVFVLLLVSAIVVALARDLLPADVVEQVVSPRPPPASCAAVVVSRDGELRAGADATAPVIGPIKRGDMLRRLGGQAGVDGAAGWHEVQLGAVRGFVAGDLARCPPDSAVKALTQKMLDAANDAAKLALALVGVLALWTGLMRVAEKAGLVALLARLLRPLLVRLFPEVPPEHPAMGAIVMNMSANLLGLGNAATPLGLQAMKHLQDLNPVKKTATNAMALFLALNTTHLTLVPAKTIAVRLEYGSTQATNIVLPTILATACGMVVAVVVARLLQRRFPVDDAPRETNGVDARRDDAQGGA